MSLESAAAGADIAAFEAMFDFDAMFDIAAAGLSASPDLERRFRRGLAKATEKGGPAKDIHDSVVQGGSYKFLRFHRHENEDRALFRSLSAAGGFDYHDVVVRRRADGTVKAVDVYDFVSGEKQSQAVRRSMVWILTPQDRTLLGRLAVKDQALFQHADKLDRLVNAARSGDPQDGLRAFDELPEHLQRDKTFLLLRLAVARRSKDEDAYLRAVDAFRRRFPDDSCVDLISIDYYILRKKFGHAHSAIDRVEKAVEGDHYLDVVRGNTFLAEEKLVKAAERFEQALRNEPTLLGAHWGLVAVGLKRQAFDDVLARLKAIDQQFALQWADLTQQPSYGEFVKSPQYQEWLKYLDVRKDN